jgi:hypothetical protein
VSDRSELMKWVLRTWEFSNEGRFYLEWFLQPDIDALDGGSILRESVLDVMENDKQLINLRKQKGVEALEAFLLEISEENRSQLREHTEAINLHLASQKRAIRKQAHSLGKIRRMLNIERIESLKFLASLKITQDSEDEAVDVLDIFKKLELVNEVAAKVASLNRTRVDAVDIETEWKLLASDDNTWKDSIERIANDPGEDWFDKYRENFDRFYAQEVISKLDGILERVANLKPVKLQVNSAIVKQLFQEAHDAFLFGFDAASIALCRSLVEHALKDRLSITSKEMLDTLIEKAGKKMLLSPESLANIRKIQRAGNDMMHNLAKLQHAAQEVLDDTRGILNELYGTDLN